MSSAKVADDEWSGSLWRTANEVYKLGLNEGSAVSIRHLTAKMTG
jgi:hypothetical protein